MRTSRWSTSPRTSWAAFPATRRPSRRQRGRHGRRPTPPMDKRAAILGFQITFLTFALLLLNAPLEKYVYSQWQWARDLELDLGRALMVLSGGMLLLAVAPLRRACAEMLAPRIPKGKIREVALALAMMWLVSLAASA